MFEIGHLPKAPVATRPRMARVTTECLHHKRSAEGWFIRSAGKLNLAAIVVNHFGAAEEGASAGWNLFSRVVRQALACDCQ